MEHQSLYGILAIYSGVYTTATTSPFGTCGSCNRYRTYIEIVNTEDKIAEYTLKRVEKFCVGMGSETSAIYAE